MKNKTWRSLRQTLHLSKNPKRKTVTKSRKQKRVQRPGNVHRGYFTQHCQKLNFGQVDKRRPKEGMGETRETLEPQDKRR